MTNGEARSLNPETATVPVKFDEVNQSDETTEAMAEIKFDKRTFNVKIYERFSRLKKSMRRRSVSIL